MKIITNPEKPSEAETILMQLNLGLKVSRFDVSIHRKEIRLIIEEGRFPHLKNDVEDLIESADASK